MKLLSLFDGEGGFPLAGIMCGIEPVYASEIEPFPIAVTRSRFPNMKHLGNVSEVNGAKLEPVDVVTFGSPCQDMSVAGKRAGLKHDEMGDEETTRSGLFFEAIRIIKEMRKATNGRYPRFAVWENVPGAFSSNGGRDFLAVLQAFASVCEPAVSIPEPERDSKTDNLVWLGAGSIVGNGWSLAWRQLDAQYFGVPQRRKRIYLVADFGSERAEEILLERYSLRGHIAESGEARERTSEDAKGCVDGGCETLVFDTTQITSKCNRSNPVWNDPCHTIHAQGDAPTVIALQANGIDRADTAGCNGAGWREDQSYTLNTIDRHAVAYSFDSLASNSMKSDNPNSGFRQVDCAKTIDTSDQNPSKNQGGICVVEQNVYPSTVGTLAANAGGLNRPAGNCNETDFCVVYGIGNGQSDQMVRKEQVGTLNCMHDQQAVMFANSSFGGYAEGCETLKASGGGSENAIVEKIEHNYIVRRLMPIETLRLQGYHDWWHDLAPFDGDVDFWESVRKAWAEINGKQYRPFKSVEQLEKWYNGLRTDAAEYKADGNSLAIPCAAYVMRRIKEFAE